MREVLTSVAEYELNGLSYLAVRRHEADRPIVHYRLDGGLYQALTVCGAGEMDLLPSLLAGAEEVGPPNVEYPVCYRVPFVPANATYCMVSGFGLAHRNKVSADKLDVSGRLPGHPTWFFKGFANTLKTEGEPLRLSGGAQVVCEEAEIVLVYLVDRDGHPRYLGFTFGNDMTDIGQIRANPSHLSYGKLGDSAIHPFLFLGEPPERANGRVRIVRQGETVWAGDITNGHAVLAYEVETMMSKLWLHHPLLVPGMMHYVYIGADRNSIDHGGRISNGDVVDIHFDGFGVRLSNPVVLGEAA